MFSLTVNMFYSLNILPCLMLLNVIRFHAFRTLQTTSARMLYEICG